MPITVNHSTPADGTFSATGAAAWDANHTLSGLGTMAEQNANNVNITGGSITGVSGLGTVTSVAATVPSVLSITGSPITSSGTLAIGYSGTALPVANGGTGATTAAEAFADLTPLTLTTASATPLVLTNTSSYQQQIIGGTNQTINLPSTATLAVGWRSSPSLAITTIASTRSL